MAAKREQRKGSFFIGIGKQHQLIFHTELCNAHPCQIAFFHFAFLRCSKYIAYRLIEHFLLLCMQLGHGLFKTPRLQ